MDPPSPMTFIKQRSVNATKLTLVDQDLHIYLMDPENIPESFAFFKSIMKQRVRTNRETWLVDVSSLENLDLFNSLPLDIDDDIIVYDQSGLGTKMWEVYKIDASYDIKRNDIGSYTKETGLEMNPIDKWKRRSDLTVNSLLIQ